MWRPRRGLPSRAPWTSLGWPGCRPRWSPGSCAHRAAKADRWPELRVAAVEDILRLSRGVVDHVVVDAGFAVEDDEELSYDTAAPRRNASTLTALESADHLVVVGAADPVGLQRLVRAVQDVAALLLGPVVVQGCDRPWLGRVRSVRSGMCSVASPGWTTSVSCPGPRTTATRPSSPGDPSSRSLPSHH